MKRTFALCSAVAVLAAGCTVGPDYRPPDTRLPSHFAHAPGRGSVDLTTWWTQFGDPQLTALVEEAAIGNFDLRIAEARVREARALRVQAASGRLPRVDLDASISRSRSSLPGGSRSFAVTNSLFDIGFDAGWEIDLFGGIRRNVEASDAVLGATEEDRRDVFVSLIAEVARNYIELRGFQQRLQVAEANLRAQRETVRLTEVRFAAGAVSDTDVQRARAQAASTAASIPDLQTAAAAALHRLSVLTGREPAALTARLAAAAPIPPARVTPGGGAPADLLRRRADIRAAERRLAAATAEIGVATADLYPRLSLTGLVGLLATSLGALDSSAARTWSFGAGATLPIFDGGRRRAEVAVQRAQAEQALSAYQATVLEAAEEVENGFVAYAGERRRRDELAQAFQAQSRAATLARQLYTYGQASFLDVLDAERQLFIAQDALTASEAALSTRLVALFKALGGGWEGSLPPVRPDRSERQPT